MNDPKEQPTKSFTTRQKWREWLERNHSKSTGIFLRIFKKDSGKKTVTHLEALDEALCFGWIDGVRKSYDDESFLQKFTPRQKRSIWSKRNQENVARLIKEQRMTNAGIAEVERAKNDGRWDRAYDSPKDMKVPSDFLKELKKNKAAYKFFKELTKVNHFAIAFRLHNAKRPETRERRMKDFLERLGNGEKIV
jgi:uncharacterized protein YdeI (YjbR/CyaY-like superfamily)